MVSGCEIQYLKLGSQDQLGVLLLYQSPCCIATSLLELLEAILQLAMEFSRLMILENFNLLSLVLVSEVAQEFMTTMVAMGLTQIISDPAQDSSHMLDMIFKLEQ